MRSVRHPNVMELKYFFYTRTPRVSAIIIYYLIYNIFILILTVLYQIG
jgi:hypothetical protein